MLAESAIAGHGTVLLIDDEEGTGSLVRRHFPGWTVIQALTLADGRDQLASLPEVCLVLLDLNLPDTLYPQPLHASPFQGSFDLARHLRDTHPGLPVVIFSAHCDATVINAAHLAGAELISKHDAAANLDLLRSRLDRAALPAPGSPATYLDWLRDHRGLSPRERDVADLAVQGMTRYADIGDALGISPNTVKRHVTHLLDRAGVDSLFDFIFRAHGIAPRSLQRPSGLRP